MSSSVGIVIPIIDGYVPFVDYFPNYNNSNHSSNMTGWWYTYPSEKYEFVNGKNYPIMENIYIVFETTYQI